jgi:CheY-like chemotaxis protein
MAWRNIPIIALTALSDEETVRAAYAAGMNDFITKPVEAAILYEKLGQLFSGSVSPAAMAAPQRLSAAAADQEGELLNLERLESFRRIGMLEELLGDYIPEIRRLVDRLERSVGKKDLDEAIDALHSLLGMSGEAGAQALHRLVRRFYVPMIETRAWPPERQWLAHLKEAAARAESALRAFGAMQSTVTAE